ncbi:MAG: hypothetical protein IJA96_06280 [Alistipes sp.]|nr:hypothetical protein [Alistipes sp.]
MNYQKFVDRLSRMTALAEGWQKSESLPAIERDLMLEELRGLYDELLDFKGDSGLAERVGATIMADTATEPIFDDVLDIDALLGLSDVERDEPKQEEVAVEPEVEIEVVVEPEPEPEPLPEPEPMSEPEPIAEPEPTVAPKGNGGLFDMEDIPVRTRSSRKMISLYTSPFAAETKPKAEEPKVEPVAKQEPKAEPAIVPEPKVEAKPEPAPVPTPAPAPVAQPTAEPVRLGDVLGGKTTTLAEKMADDSAPTAAFNRITDLRKAIGLNDKFLMIRDLFDGDAARYEDTITTLNEFDDLDECMIYIVENFVWNPDSEGAKLLVSLIERKLA